MTGNKPIHRRSTAVRWIVGFVLLLGLAALRVPWREADSGNSTFWSYAYFSYDEACYTSGGRLACLTGKFLDPEVSEPTTFGSGWGMHFLAYPGYLFDGLTFGAMRWPSIVLAIAGWLAIYHVACRRTVPLLAGTVVGILSCNPASLTYERTASTDVVVGSLAAIAFALVTATTPGLGAAAGAAIALACCVKANAVVLLPLVVLAALSNPTGRWRRIIFLAISFVLALAALWLGRQWALVAASQGRGIEWVLKECARWQFSLLDLRYSPLDWLKPLSVFPRWQNSFMLGPFVFWSILLPLSWLLVKLDRRRPHRLERFSIPVGMVIYVIALASQPNNALRHYIPLLFFTPLLLIQSRRMFRHRPTSVEKDAYDWKSVGLIAVSFAALFALYWFQIGRGWSEEKVRTIAYNEVSVPFAAWTYIGLRVSLGWLMLSVIFVAVMRKQWGCITTIRILTMCGLALPVVWLFFANYTISLLSIKMDFVVNQLLLQLSLVIGAFLLTSRLRPTRWQSWYATHAAILIVFVVGNTYWSKAYRELANPSFYTLAASRQLSATIPSNALVIGRRAATLLRNTPIRTGLCGFHFSPDEFVNRVVGLLETQPGRPLFWLVDGDDDLQWDWYSNHGRDRWSVVYVGSVTIPSGDLLRIREVKEDLPMVPIHLFRLHPKPSTAPNPPSLSHGQ